MQILVVVAMMLAVVAGCKKQETAPATGTGAPQAAATAPGAPGGGEVVITQGQLDAYLAALPEMLAVARQVSASARDPKTNQIDPEKAKTLMQEVQTKQEPILKKANLTREDYQKIHFQVMSVYPILTLREAVAQNPETLKRLKEQLDKPDVPEARKNQLKQTIELVEAKESDLPALKHVSPEAFELIKANQEKIRLAMQPAKPAAPAAPGQS